MANPNTAVFPTSVAADTDLPVVKDSAYTTLAANINNSVTSIQFTDASAYTVPCLIQLENELVLAQGPVVGNTIQNCIRGFRGSVASHNAGVVGFGYIFDHLLNQHSAEIKAIENALGANLSHVAKTTTALTGDLGGTIASPTVSQVGGASASSVATAASKAHDQNTDSGTSSSTFQIGTLGLKVKNVGTALEVRNAADSDYADLTVKNLVVQGTTTTIHSATLNVGDNIITLNSDLSGSSSPSSNAGIEVNRGNQTKSNIIWNESTDKWQAGIQGSEADILLSGQSAGGDLSGTYPNPSLPSVNANTGTFGDGTHVAQITVDAKGRITAASSVTITGAAPTGAAGGDLTGTFPNPTLATANANVGSFGDSTHVPRITVDAKGRVTAVTTQLLTPVHLVGTSSAPTIATGAGAGTGSDPAHDPVASVTGNDNAGKITVGTGDTSPGTNATIATVTFDSAFASAPSAVILVPANATTAALAVAKNPYVSAITTTGFTIKSNATGLDASTTYVWYFVVIG